MTPDTLRFILQVIAVAIGGGSVQLMIFLLRRRSELRSLDAKTAADTHSVSDRQIDQLQEDVTHYRDLIREFETKMSRLEDRHIQAQREFSEQLRVAHAENTRLATRVAQLQTDLDISQRQIDDLRRRI